MKQRYLTIGAYWDSSSYVQPTPYIRIMGRWLEKAGFEIGDTIQVEVGYGRLVIQHAEGMKRVAEPSQLELFVDDVE